MEQCVFTQDANSSNDYYRVHADSLVPAEHARREAEHVAEIETAQHGGQSGDQSQIYNVLFDEFHKGIIPFLVKFERGVYCIYTDSLPERG